MSVTAGPTKPTRICACCAARSRTRRPPGGVIGGAGANTLADRGSGYNILIGGGGASATLPGNTLTGNGNDILISGTTSYGSNTAANLAAN